MAPVDMLTNLSSIDENSLTPYSDATRCRKKTTHVKRPMNAFMVWSQIERRRIIAERPDVHNAEISKQLGQVWRSLSDAERKPYVARSETLRELHRKQYPDYKYKPKKKPSQENVPTKPKSSKAKAHAKGKVCKTTSKKKLSKKNREQQAQSVQSVHSVRSMRQSSVEVESEESNCGYHEREFMNYNSDSGGFDSILPTPAATPESTASNYFIENSQVSSVNNSQPYMPNLHLPDSLGSPLQFMDPDMLIDPAEAPTANMEDLPDGFTPANAHMELGIDLGPLWSQLMASPPAP